MQPYSQDLRDRIIHMLEAGQDTQPAVAERFRVSPSFVAKLWQRWRHSGTGAAKPHAGGTARRLKDHTETLRNAVAQHPDATLEELRDHVVAAQGPQVSPATICRELQRLRLSRKKSRFTPRNGRPNASRPCAPHSGRRSQHWTSTG
jgi:transposase